MINVPVLGDSQTDTISGFGVRPSGMHSARLGELFAAAGIAARVRAYGRSGDTTAQALARLDAMSLFAVPDMAVVYIGVNDPGASISQAGTQLNVQATLAGLKHRANGPGVGLGGPVAVADQTALPATGKLGQRYVALADTSTTGGAAGWTSVHATTITGTATGPTVWEFRQPLAGEAGWGRVAKSTTIPTGCKRIVVLSTNYLNFTTGGDTLTTPYAAYAPVRAAQQAAVTAENVVSASVPSVVYADLYALMKGRIQAGTDPDFSAVAYDQTKSWHWTQNNQHHSAYGHALVAQAVWSAIPAAWLTALAAL